MPSLWLKSVWIPFWVIQLGFSLLVIIFAGLSIGLSAVDLSQYNNDDGYTISDPYDDDFDENSFDIRVIYSNAIFMFFAFVTLALNIVQIVQFARNTLSPVTAVVLNVINTVIWMVLFILVFVVLYYVGINWIWAIILWISGLGMVIYSGVILGRVRREARDGRGAYAVAQNPAYPQQATGGMTLGPGTEPMAANANYGGSSAMAGHVQPTTQPTEYYNQDTSYDPHPHAHDRVSPA